MRTLKVIVGGEGNVGKTSLIRKYAKDKFSEARNITLGIDITTQEFTVHGDTVRLAIWDIEGQAGNRPNFYIGAQAGMLVYDVTEPASLQALVEWYERCVRFAPDAPLLVVGNKIDLGLVMPPQWGRVFARHIGARHGFLSAKTGENVAQAFTLLAEAAYDRARAAQR
ncbi:MAG: Rab family GTPase [Sphaerobacter sp.]|nr:Rab family GTPase [Sphaerobacter sp.]